MIIKVTGYACAEAKVRNVGDLRELVAWCDHHRVGGGAPIDWGRGEVFIDLTGDNPAEAEMIQCGDHIPPDDGWDVLINTHKHQSLPESYEEALEQGYDRYGDETRPE